MIKITNYLFKKGLTKLGFNSDDNCFFLVHTSSNELPTPQLKFHLEKADDFDATAVYLRKQLNGNYKPQVYLYDFTERNFNEQNQDELTKIQKEIWSRGEVPLACIFYSTEIKILNCTTHIQEENYLPVHLVTDLKYVGEAHHLYNEQFALKIKSGVFWDEEENRNIFRFKNSAYDKLIENIRYIISYLKKEYQGKINEDLITKIIVQAILIKYLEERIDRNGNKLLTNKYFKKYDKSDSFIDVLQNGKFVELLSDLNDPKTGFNGNVFQWSKEEQQKLKGIELSPLAELLDTKKTSIKSPQFEIDFLEWRYFEFRYIPVELISRLYEEFLGVNKKNKGLYFTPSHLAQLLVDEAIPLKKYNEIDPYNFHILDPACGSGIFLVTAFRRLVQIWRLRNNMDDPEPEELKKILNNVFGVDQEEQAINLASFSLCLALCNELKPLIIINDLKFDDLKENNLIKSDFFIGHKLQDKKFDLVIGNPPFARGGTRLYKDNFWQIDDQKVKIPNSQIALKFLSDSYSNLKYGGIQCLIIKSSSLLYNSTSKKFKQHLFSKTNVIQILDFTTLAEGKALWDNGARVGTAAIFISRSPIEFEKNILHVTFRRTNATKERIVFEIDVYDLHYVTRDTAINCDYIWKINLLGGGRIKIIIDKLLRIPPLIKYLNDNKSTITWGEGAGGAKSLPNKAFSVNGIHDEFLSNDYKNSFKNHKDKEIYKAPNFIIKENIDLPFCINNKKTRFSNEIVGFHSKDKEILKTLFNYFKINHNILRFFSICTSGKMLVIKDTAMKMEDIVNLPFSKNKNLKLELSGIDNNIIYDVNYFMQTFLRQGTRSKAVKSIIVSDLSPIIKNYSSEFLKILNLVYEKGKKKFRLSDVVTLGEMFIATIFKYDTNSKETVFHSGNSKLNLKALTDLEISKHLTVNRIIKMYPQKDTIVFIKPNQYRYWLSLTAYRDADKCFSDLSSLGY